MPEPRPRALLRPLAGLTVAVSLAVACAKLIQERELVTVQSVSPAAHDCGQCHVQIYQEWSGSAHARAFTSPTFQRATLDARTASCLPCHVPESVLRVSGEPLARAERLDEGVTCIACHLDTENHAMAGPLRGMGPVVPHPVEEGDERFHSSALCITCHAGTGRETQAGAPLVGDARTCQQCHMTEVERKTTQATDALSTAIVAMHAVHTMRSHTFELDAVADFPGAVVIDASRGRGGDLQISAVNRLPHPIPTGDFGVRIARLRATLRDAAGAALASTEQTFTNREDASLAPASAAHLALPDEPGARRLEIALTRESEGGRDRITIAQTDYAIAHGALRPLPATPEVTAP
jgi:hypothetical protein